MLMARAAQFPPGRPCAGSSPQPLVQSPCTQQAPDKCVLSWLWVTLLPRLQCASSLRSQVLVLTGLQNAAQIHPLHAWYWHGFLGSTEEFTVDSLSFLIHLPLPGAQELRVVNRPSLPIWVLSPLHALILPCPL